MRFGEWLRRGRDPEAARQRYFRRRYGEEEFAQRDRIDRVSYAYFAGRRNVRTLRARPPRPAPRRRGATIRQVERRLGRVLRTSRRVLDPDQVGR